MFVRGLFVRSNILVFKLSQQLGRTFNHLEDLVFLYGSQGAIEALDHLADINSASGSNSIRFKWDGGSQVFWGREEPYGKLILATHNSWQKHVKSYSSEDMFQFITQNNATIERVCFAEQFANLYPLLDKVTPLECVGFYYADVMYLSRPELHGTDYVFFPNKKSKTSYIVSKTSKLGERISKSQVFLAGHAYFATFGAKEQYQDPAVSFTHFNYLPDIIVHDPIYNNSQLHVSASELEIVRDLVDTTASCIDQFLLPRSGLADLREIIYKYVNYSAKQQQLHTLSKDSFFTWLSSANVSNNKRAKIKILDVSHPTALDSMFLIVKHVQRIKNDVITQLELSHSADIRDSNGEGRVRYADNTKQFGHVKLVPRHRWTPQ